MLATIGLCLCVLASELLVRHTRARLLGSALLVILLGALLANLGVIPAGSTPERPEPVYEAIFTWLAPLAIFWLLLQVELRSVLRAGLPMLLMFLLGSAGVVAGALLGMTLLGDSSLLGDQLGPLAGMYTGTYVGGSINFNAIALHYRVAEQGRLFAGAVVVDNVLSTGWMAVTLLVPRLFDRKALPERAEPAEPLNVQTHDRETIEPIHLATMLALGLLALAAAQALAEWLSLPMILVLTLLALVLAQLPALSESWGVSLRFSGARVLGMFAVYLFLAVVGAHCDLAALGHIGALGLELLVLAGVIVGVHGLLTFVVARILRIDMAVAAVASQANVGGGTTALALARSLGRDDLVVPGILCGSVGNALGTFLGFWIAGMV